MAADGPGSGRRPDARCPRVRGAGPRAGTERSFIDNYPGRTPASDPPPARPAAGGGERHVPAVRGKSGNRSSAMLVSGLLALALGITAVSLPVPYVVESPGPTFNTLGEDNGKPVISVTGHETFPAKGNLDLTTVYVNGGPNGPVTVFEALSAWLDGTKAVYPEELMFPTGVTKEQSQQESATAMTTSQENAVAAALKELNIPFGRKCRSPACRMTPRRRAFCKQGDVLVSINGKPITALGVVQAELAAGKGRRSTSSWNAPAAGAGHRHSGEEQRGPLHPWRPAAVQVHLPV